MNSGYQEDAIVSLCRNIIAINYSDLPADAIEIAKKCVIDTLGVTVAGSTALGCEPIATMIRDWGGREESTILTYGDRVPGPNAAWINAMMARAFDFDSYDHVSSEHASVATVIRSGSFTVLTIGNRNCTDPRSKIK